MRLGLVTMLKEKHTQNWSVLLLVGGGGGFFGVDEAMLKNLSQHEPLLFVYEKHRYILQSTSAVSCRIVETDMCANTKVWLWGLGEV